MDYRVLVNWLSASLWEQAYYQRQLTWMNLFQDIDMQPVELDDD
jgi:hypothetical protein